MLKIIGTDIFKSSDVNTWIICLPRGIAVSHNLYILKQENPLPLWRKPKSWIKHFRIG